MCDASRQKYAQIIALAEQEHSGNAWQRYDVVFRRKAANKHLTKWSDIDPTLWNRAFSGQSRLSAFCSSIRRGLPHVKGQLSLSLLHTLKRLRISPVWMLFAYVFGGTYRTPTIKVYLAAVRSLHIEASFPHLFDNLMLLPLEVSKDFTAMSDNHASDNTPHPATL